MGGGASAADVSKADPEVARMMAQADASTSEAARDLEATKQVTEKVKAKVGALERRGKRTTTGGTDFIIGRGGSLGLRHFAMKVCKKIEHKKLTTYSEVADELVEEVKDLPEAQGDEKNIRRRVYDGVWPLHVQILWRPLPSEFRAVSALTGRPTRAVAVSHPRACLCACACVRACVHLSRL